MHRANLGQRGGTFHAFEQQGQFCTAELGRGNTTGLSVLKSSYLLALSLDIHANLASRIQEPDVRLDKQVLSRWPG